MLYLAREVLESLGQITSMIQCMTVELRCPGITHTDQSSHDLLEYLRQIQGHMRTAAALVKQAEGTSSLVSHRCPCVNLLHICSHLPQLSKLLDYRRADLLRAQTVALAQIGLQTNAQGTHLGNLAEEVRVDSRFTKKLTFIAIIYMPANLLAVSMHGRDMRFFFSL